MACGLSSCPDQKAPATGSRFVPASSCSSSVGSVAFSSDFAQPRCTPRSFGPVRRCSLILHLFVVLALDVANRLFRLPRVRISAGSAGEQFGLCRRRSLGLRGGRATAQRRACRSCGVLPVASRMARASRDPPSPSASARPSGRSLSLRLLFPLPAAKRSSTNCLSDTGPNPFKEAQELIIEPTTCRTELSVGCSVIGSLPGCSLSGSAPPDERPTSTRRTPPIAVSTLSNDWTLRPRPNRWKPRS